MREGVAAELKIALYRQYNEPQAAAFIGIDLSTLKRWRREGKVPYLQMSERKVRFLGIHIVDIILGAKK
jgi:predicted site-specific integrase-resolvase